MMDQSEIDELLTESKAETNPRQQANSDTDKNSAEERDIDDDEIDHEVEESDKEETEDLPRRSGSETPPPRDYEPS